MSTDHEHLPTIYRNWFKDIQHKDKALHRKSKLIKRLREENEELVKENDKLRWELYSAGWDGNYKAPPLTDEAKDLLTHINTINRLMSSVDERSESSADEGALR